MVGTPESDRIHLLLSGSYMAQRHPSWSVSEVRTSLSFATSPLERTLLTSLLMEDWNRRMRISDRIGPLRRGFSEWNSRPSPTA